MPVSQDELNAKLKFHYGEYVVDKGIANMQDIRRVPRFVSEHLLTKISDESDEQKFSEKLVKMIELVNMLYPEAKDKDKILDKVIIKRQPHRIIDEIKVEIDETNELRVAIIPTLNLRNVMILDSIVDQNEQLLSTGIWGIAAIRYSDPVEDSTGNKLTLPIIIDEFKPFHVSNINVEDFIKKREHFTTEEWIDTLINTIGLNPDVYNERQKLLVISRFVPVIENNINLMEFGPRATGKTFFYRNISFYSRIISGGKITPAQLFYHIARKTVGEIGMKDCLVFDEIAKLKFQDPNEMMGKLKDYMVDGHFERGPKKGTSLCSLVFMGNIEVSGYVPAEDINYALPEFMRNDTAFIDRIHGVIPGWEIPKIRKSDIHLSKNYGFSLDFFSEVLHEMRKIDFTPLIREMVELQNITIRDEIGIYRLASGLTKVLFPNKQFTESDLDMIMKFAVEYRQKIADLLYKMAPGEFEKKKISYNINM